MAPGTHNLETVRRFARALDEEQWDELSSVLADVCRYDSRQSVLHDKDEIVASYADNAAWCHENLDGVEYASAIRQIDGNTYLVEFTDRLRIGDARHVFVCEQRVQVDDRGQVAHVIHRDLPGQIEALNAFLSRHNVSRPDGA